ncbi:hypothetical protein V6N11_031138 [Hibiscus sabdariffa]|uniref:RNase H type-1 domain-containing protein n=1 Tax=Hibiscus sabdariffa TaxID=183260 RepID=A0ABR1ZE31_9ROSI
MMAYSALGESPSGPWILGYKHVDLEVDNVTVARVLNGSSLALCASTLMQMIKDFLARDWKVTVSHVPREVNMVANKLASLSCGLPLGMTSYTTPPASVDPLLLVDIM